jgi:hypothetical protein
VESSRSKRRRRYGLLAATIVTLIAIAPQLYFCFLRGNEWNGAYAQTHGDESVYAAYLNALIDGRPLRTNPYTGRESSSAAPDQLVAESYLSVQSFPPLLIASIARVLHVSTAKAFIALTALTAFASALAIFWLLSLLTGDDALAAVGVLLVLFFGSSNLVAEYLLRIGDSNNYLPFLRRYVPGAPFPLLFCYCALVYRMATAAGKRAAVLFALGAGCVFVTLIFSYVYHWTFALVWTFCLAAIWAVMQFVEMKRVSLRNFAASSADFAVSADRFTAKGAKESQRTAKEAGTSTGRRSIWQVLARFGLLAVVMLAALAPYLYLTSRLGSTTADVHFLAASHAPDLFRLPEIIGLLTLVALGWLIIRGSLSANNPSVICVLAFAVTPFFVFNQQILTGKSLQPFHYEVFIGNYTAVLAAFLTAWFGVRNFLKTRPRFARALALAFVCAAILSGAAEAVLMTRHQLKGNLISDAVRPALLRLAEIGRKTEDGKLDTRSVVYAPNFVVANALPSTAPQPVLWAQYLFLFPDVTLAEDKERLAQFLYYKGVSFSDIDENHLDSLDNERAYYLSSLIKRGRFNPRLSVDWQPIAPEEVRGALAYYADFVATFDRDRAAHPELSYLLINPEQHPELANFDRWYERDAGERVGSYMLFRVRLKPL